MRAFTPMRPPPRDPRGLGGDGLGERLRASDLLVATFPRSIEDRPCCGAHCGRWMV